MSSATREPFTVSGVVKQVFFDVSPRIEAESEEP